MYRSHTHTHTHHRQVQCKSMCIRVLRTECYVHIRMFLHVGRSQYSNCTWAGVLGLHPCAVDRSRRRAAGSRITCTSVRQACTCVICTRLHTLAVHSRVLHVPPQLYLQSAIPVTRIPAVEPERIPLRYCVIPKRLYCVALLIFRRNVLILNY